jgi:hypothetical protein
MVEKCHIISAVTKTEAGNDGKLQAQDNSGKK